MNRNESLDALRGFAILTMVLSGSIAFGGVLPAWMYHAQVPPPLHKFNPAIPGITWVDLVFPFFLFSMGAALPMSLSKTIDKGIGSVVWIAFRRFLLLAFFALFTQHMKAWVIAPEPDYRHYALSILAFVLLFFMLYDYKGLHYKKLFLALKIIAFAAALCLLYVLPFHGGKGFMLSKSDIIILVLANMAFFGTIIYRLTHNKPWLRIGILPFIMAIFLAGKEPADSWTKTFLNFNAIGSFDISWLYKFYFLKYLFIIIPGTFAGEWLMKAMLHHKEKNNQNSQTISIAFLSIGLIGLNLYGLFTRQLILNVSLTLMVALLLFYLLHQSGEANKKSYQMLLQAGIYVLLLGLCFEAYEGGIKKDSSTYSYYFVTTGLAFLILIAFDVFSKMPISNTIVHYLALNGRNPMIAYVAGSLLLTPLLKITALSQSLDLLNTNPWAGFLKGVIFTTIVSLITIFCTKQKWFWKT
jgi:predicted acyltransferase